LKKTFISATIFHYFDPERKIEVEIDSSNLVVIGILLQYDNDGILHPMTYFSRKYPPMKINHKIYDRELFAIVHAIGE
jgi:hypothetical protein